MSTYAWLAGLLLALVIVAAAAVARLMATPIPSHRPPGIDYEEPAQNPPLPGEDSSISDQVEAIETPAHAGASPQPPGSPLELDCRPVRFTLTLRHAALRYRLRLSNPGPEALGPLIIRADLATAEAEIPQDRQAIFEPYALPLCHYLDSLAAGGHAELVGELRLPLAGVAAIRLGTAKLLVPLLRVWVETAGDARPALSCAGCFAIGVLPAAAGSGFQPIDLDSSLGIWRKLTARRLESANFPQF